MNHHDGRNIVIRQHVRDVPTTEAMFARHVRRVPNHAALVRKADHEVGRHLADVLRHAGYLDIDVLAALSYDPGRADGYVAGREPGQDIAAEHRQGLKVLVEGWEWLVRQGFLMRACTGPGWELTRHGESFVG